MKRKPESDEQKVIPLDLSQRAGAEEALRRAAALVIASGAEEIAARALLERWVAAVDGAKSLAIVAGATRESVADAEKRGQKNAGTFAGAERTRFPSDFTTSERAEEAVQLAARAKLSLSQEVYQHEAARMEAVDRLQSVRRLVVEGKAVSDAAAREILETALAKASLPPAWLERALPQTERSIVDLIVQVLRVEQRPMRTKELIEAIQKLGKKLDSRNRPATIFSAIKARRDAPVVSVAGQRGMWRLRQPDEPVPSGRPALPEGKGG
ncbi:MAG: hypothetical protein EXR72_26360 [Myxococcales bacterium]|nr:hypothetical protein [Myxococcales bacterium]